MVFWLLLKLLTSCFYDLNLAPGALFHKIQCKRFAPGRFQDCTLTHSYHPSVLCMAYFKPVLLAADISIVVSARGSPSSMHNHSKYLVKDFCGVLQVFSQVNHQRILNKFAYFPTKICKPFELKCGNLRSCVQQETLATITSIFAAVTMIFISSLQLINTKKTVQSFQEGARLLAFLNHTLPTMFRS